MRKTIFSKVIFIVIRTPKLFNKVVYRRNKLKNSIEANKEKYYLYISKGNTRKYWQILKSFRNDNNIPYAPSLLHEDRYIIKCKVWAELFNQLFATQCSKINNSSVLSSVLFKFQFRGYCKNN